MLPFLLGDHVWWSWCHYSSPKAVNSCPGFDNVTYPDSGGASISLTPALDCISSNHPSRFDPRFAGPWTGNESVAQSTRFARTVTLRGRELTAQSADLTLEDETKEWMVQVEPGVHIIFVSLWSDTLSTCVACRTTPVKMFHMLLLIV